MKVDMFKISDIFEYFLNIFMKPIFFYKEYMLIKIKNENLYELFQIRLHN